MRKNEDFLKKIFWQLQRISKEVENQIFRHNWIFRHTCVYKQSAFTKYRNYNIFVQIWYNCFRYAGRLFLGCARFVAVALSQLYEKRRRNKDWATKERTQKNLCKGHHFFDCTPSFLCHFLLLICLLPFPSDVPTERPNKDRYCYGWYSVWCWKYENILQFSAILSNLFLITAVAQVTAKTTNSERAIYFLSLKSCSIEKLKSHMLFTCKNFMFFDFTWKKKFVPGNGGGAGAPPPLLHPFLYGPDLRRLILLQEVDYNQMLQKFHCK